MARSGEPSSLPSWGWSALQWVSADGTGILKGQQERDATPVSPASPFGFRGSLPYSGATAPLQPTGNLRHRIHLGLKHTCVGQPYDLPVLVVWLDMNKAEKLGFCLLEASE